jgi:hypothetical protein
VTQKKAQLMCPPQDGRLGAVKAGTGISIGEDGTICSAAGGEQVFLADSNENIWSCNTAPDFSGAYKNFFAGYGAGCYNVGGYNNSFIGVYAGVRSSDTSATIAMGYCAGADTCSLYSGIAIGDYAGQYAGAGGGGTNTFSGVFNTSVGTSGGSVDVHTLTITEIPSHDHAGTTSGNGGHIHNMWLGDPSIPPGSGETAIWREDVSGGRGYYTNDSTGVYPFTQEAGWHSHTVYAQGGGGGHAHGFTNPTFNLDVRYATAIVCTKD